MLNWFQKKLFKTSNEQLKTESINDIFSKPLTSLTVKPDNDESDADACSRLLQLIEETGVKTLNDANHIPISIEDFFHGNRAKHSIAANCEPPPPFDNITAWYEHLKFIRSNENVHDVFVEILMIEPDEDGSLRIWPYSDTVWIYSSLDISVITDLLLPLEPDEIRDSSVKDGNWSANPPIPVPEGIKPYCIWWD